MNREQLSKYKKNKRDIENLDGIIAKLQERLDTVPVVKRNWILFLISANG